MPDITLRLCVHTAPTSPKAVMVSKDGNQHQAAWLPRSLIKIELIEDGNQFWNPANVTMPAKIAAEKGLRS